MDLEEQIKKLIDVLKGEESRGSRVGTIAGSLAGKTAKEQKKYVEELKRQVTLLEKNGDLSKKENALSLNQTTRWINTKEEHATNIQDRISHYFLIQRIKPKKGKEYDLYVKQTTLLHQIMVAAMKCKQTVDSKNVTDALKLLDQFIDSYFDEHGKNHIKKIDH